MPNATSNLTEGTTLRFQGKTYVVIQRKPVNYLVAREGDNKVFNLRRSSTIEVVGTDLAWMSEALLQRENAKAERRAIVGSDDANVGINPDGTARFLPGTPVLITGKGAGRWEGKQGVIVKKFSVRYRVNVDGLIVNVPFAMTRRVQKAVVTDF